MSEGARFYAVTSGLATGLLLGAGFEISRLWTGSTYYFRFDYLFAAVVPMVFGAFAVLAHNILTNTNAPLFGTLGRWLQLALTALCVALLPIQDLGLTMLIALSVGEVIGFLPLAYRGVSRLVPGVGGWFHLKESAVSTGAAVISTGLTQGVLLLVPWTTVTGRTVAVLIAVLVNAMLIPWFGVRSHTRQAVLSFIYPRLATSHSTLNGN